MLARYINRLPQLVATLLIPALFVLASGGCALNRAQSPVDPSVETGGYPLTVTDDMGRQITLDSAPERLVSLAPSNTEILFALGLGDKVVAVDDYSDYPPEAANLPKVGGFSKPSVEKIVSLQPDLVFATSIHEEAVKRLQELGMLAVVVRPGSLDDLLESIKWIGLATSAQERADELIRQMRNRIDQVQSRVSRIPMDKRPWVYYEVYSDPIMTVGPRTLISQLIETAGGRNIAYDADADYPKFSSETIIKRNPEVIIFPEFHGSTALTVEQVRSRDGWSEISAVKDGKVYGIDANIISRPGPRAVDALEQLVRIIHPGLLD
ncbi:MAG: cobalamin-binding protein [Bacillota bacterium]